MTRGTEEELLEFDRRHLWHPYASMLDQPRMLSVARAEGVRLQLSDGRRLIDGMSSWWAAIHGYNHPQLNQAATQQLHDMAHVMFGGLTHRPAMELGQQLLALVPPGLEKIFFSDSGSVAVEVAMKLALQYRQARGETQQSRFLALRGGYHGDTWHAMSVCDPVTGMHQLFSASLPQQLFAPRPARRWGELWQKGDSAAIEELAEEHREQLTAIILEPVVQGAGGMYFYHPEYLRRVRQLCDRLGLLLIADEIATGFGRSGKLFACEHATISPDILCVGKALTGGYLSLGATLCRTEIAETISGAAPGVFMHGPTFMANPLACRVAGASLALLRNRPWQQEVQAIQGHLETGLAPARLLPQVADVRILGAIGVIEMRQTVNTRRLTPLLLEHGVWLRPFGRLIYTMPPYPVTHTEVEQICSAMIACATAQGQE
ncbi:MAG: adenosylmethionine--8-amino-7-oxononanoate transaminase [Desulfobulbaceae bacterium A2]|nr:MAG: adenosylmethionine--8-amino-7-oxononanoate transaminase [Desulfobulbaceae bacterium A2]